MTTHKKHTDQTESKTPAPIVHAALKPPVRAPESAPEPVVLTDEVVLKALRASPEAAKEAKRAPAPFARDVPKLGQRIRCRDENGVVSVADVVGHADDGSLYMHVLYRDGIAGNFNRSGVRESIDGGPGWFYPED